MNITFWSVVCKATAGICTLGVLGQGAVVATTPSPEQPAPVVEQTAVTAPVTPSDPPEAEPIKETLAEEADTAPARQPQPSVQATPTAATPSSDSYAEPQTAVVVSELIERYRGLCPHQIPDWEPLKKAWARSATMGLDTVYNDNPTQAGLEDAWVEYRNGVIKFDAYVGGVANGLLPKVDPNYNIGFYIDWGNKLVYWENVWEENRPDSRHITGDYPSEWDDIATRLTNELRRIENAYNAKCPND